MAVAVGEHGGAESDNVPTAQPSSVECGEEHPLSGARSPPFADERTEEEGIHVRRWEEQGQGF